MSGLERLRLLHEDIESIKKLAAAALQSRSDPSNPHPRLQSLSGKIQDTRAAEKLAADLAAFARNIASNLHSHYVSESSDIDSETHSTSSFYASLRELRDIHRNQTPPALVSPQRDSVLAAAYQPVQFSGEEGDGRFLDLQPFFRQFVNLTKQTSLQYYEYIRDKLTCDQDVPASLKCKRAYEQYLSSVVSYLIKFAIRAYPLEQIENYMDDVISKQQSALQTQLEHLTTTYEDAENLMQEMGDHKVKTALSEFALKCGGRPAERAKRLWTAAQKCTYGQAALQHKLLCFLADELLAEERAATVANVEKKLSLSYTEIEAERISAETSNIPDEDNEQQHLESTVYNPKDVPLGWDGKPIPYWMYKLHGLNHEFKCEICGGATYKGPRTFERHFTEGAHICGLRRLGIPYSKAFMMITSIHDALNLQERIIGQEKSIQFDSTREVEVEDEHGNVMNLKTLQDLKKQGLL